MIRVESVGKATLLRFDDGTQLTSETAMRAVTAILKSINPPFRVVLDFSGIAALDSAGLGAIVQTYKRIREAGGELQLACVPEGYARNIFTITRLDTVFRLHDDVDSALLAFGETRRRKEG